MQSGRMRQKSSASYTHKVLSKNSLMSDYVITAEISIAERFGLIAMDMNFLPDKE